MHIAHTPAVSSRGLGILSNRQPKFAEALLEEMEFEGQPRSAGAGLHFVLCCAR